MEKLIQANLAYTLDGKFNLRLIPLFDGTGLVFKWEKVELVCSMSSIKQPEHVILLRLTEGAFATYQQLEDKEKANADQIKTSLYAAIMMEEFAAYDHFTAQQICQCVSGRASEAHSVVRRVRLWQNC